VEPNDLCQIALALRQWTLYLRILEVNELVEYTADGKALLAYKPVEEYRGTQERIDYMYRAMIAASKPLSIVQSDKKYHRLRNWLKQVIELAEMKKYEVVKMFPRGLVLSLLDQQHH